MSDSPPSKYDCGTITHTDSNQKVNLEFLDPSTSVTSEKKKSYYGKCSCGSGKDVWYCQPGTQKREFCSACKPEDAVATTRKTTKATPLKHSGYHIINLPNSSIPHHHIHSLLHNSHGIINTSDPDWSTIFNDKFHEKKTTKRFMKKLNHKPTNSSNQFNQSLKIVESLLTAIINNDDKKKKGSILTISDLTILTREKGLSPQIWHRDELKGVNGKFIIYPLSPDYTVYVIPHSHKVPQDKPVNSDSAIKLNLQPGQIFIGDSSLVHAGGEANSSNIPYVLSNGKECFDLAFHAYVSEGLNVNLSSEFNKSEETVVVEVISGKNGKKEAKPSKKLSKVSDNNAVNFGNQKPKGRKRKNQN